MPEPLTLIFAYHYPPENTIGAARPFRFAKYLSRLGHNCHVITAADVRRSPELNAQYVPDRFITNPKEGVGYEIERLIRRLLLPGVTGTQWAVHAYQAALRYLRDNPHGPVTVLSTYPPLGTHLAGYWLSQRKKLPWIADLRDPVADNPGTPGYAGVTQPTYRKLERIFVRAADRVIANTDAAAQKLQRAYPDRANRIQVIWNGFDPEQRLRPLPLPERGQRILAHVGELYGGRSLAPILYSVRRLVDQGRVDPAAFQIRQVGDVVPTSVPDAEFNARAEAEGWWSLRAERVQQSEAHRLIQTAHGLLLIQPQSALQVPGKLYEYLQIGRPILAFVPKNSPVERILSRSGIPFVCVYPDVPAEELDRGVEQFIRLDVPDTQPNAWFEQEFNAEDHARRVSAMIGELTGVPAGIPTAVA
jgi:glycosyltransferase involved in cell wall biosynthesis